MICRVPAHKVNAKSNIRFRCENGVSKKKTRKHSFGNELAKQTIQQLFRSAGLVILPGCFSQINVDAGSDVISYNPLSDESFNFQERLRAYSLTDVSATA
jgi:hypothetical protein